MSERGINFNLECRRLVWHVVKDVPPSLREAMRKRRLVKSTGTRDLGQARIRRHTILAEFMAEIERARRGATLGVNMPGLTGEALGWRRDIEAASKLDDPMVRADAEMSLVERAEDLENTHGFAAAKAFADVGLGIATPLTLYLEEWLAQTTYKDRQKADVRNSFAKLGAWLRGERLGETIEGVTDRVASTYKAKAMVGAGMHPKTANKLMSFLRVHWAWLKTHGYFDGPNPWAGKSLKKPKPSADDLERPFSDAEMITLFTGPADQAMRDLMAIAALSGMRLEEIYQLQGKHCQGGVFRIAKGKTASARREVPIHSELMPLVARRLAGKGSDGYLFEEAAKGWDDTRSSYVSKRFGAYRQKVGIHDKPEGKRRSLVNGHSFRRWFITKADRAGCRKEDIERVVGHKPDGESLGRYSGGITLEQRRTVVEAVKLSKGVKLASGSARRKASVSS